MRSAFATRHAFRLTLCLAASLSPALAQVPAPSSTAALLTQLSQTKRVGDVAISPDGKTLAMDLAGNLTIAPVADPSGGRTVTLCPASGSASDSDPRKAGISALT